MIDTVKTNKLPARFPANVAEFNIVTEVAMHLKPDLRDAIIKQHVSKVLTDATRKMKERGAEESEILSVLFEKAQSMMTAEHAQRFAQEVLDAYDIDARRPEHVVIRARRQVKDFLGIPYRNNR